MEAQFAPCWPGREGGAAAIRDTEEHKQKSREVRQQGCRGFESSILGTSLCLVSVGTGRDGSGGHRALHGGWVLSALHGAGSLFLHL